MTIKKYFASTFILLIFLTSCDNSPDMVSADNYYQLRKQLFHYKFVIDMTTDIKEDWLEFANDSLEQVLVKEAKKVTNYIDTIKTYLIGFYKIKEPYNMTMDEIVNYSFKDSLFSYASLNKVFCGEFGEKPNTKFNVYTLHEKLTDFYKNAANITGDKANKYLFYPRTYEMSDGVKITWEYQHFYKNNLIITLTNLELRKQEVYLTIIDIKNHRRHNP